MDITYFRLTYFVEEGIDMLSRAGCVVVPALLAFTFLTAALVRAERIRTAIPGLNLNYLSVFTAEARGFSKTRVWKMKPS
jgi:hypothetical protein